MAAYRTDLGGHLGWSSTDTEIPDVTPAVEFGAAHPWVAEPSPNAPPTVP